MQLFSNLSYTSSLVCVPNPQQYIIPISPQPVLYNNNNTYCLSLNHANIQPNITNLALSNESLINLRRMNTISHDKLTIANSTNPQRNNQNAFADDNTPIFQNNNIPFVVHPITTNQAHQFTQNPLVFNPLLNRNNINHNPLLNHNKTTINSTISITAPQSTDLMSLRSGSRSKRGRKRIDRTAYLNAEGRYQCSLCSRSYKRYNDLKGHCKVHEVNNKGCPYCGKKFSRPIYLSDHIRSHTGEKPFSCNICCKKFKAKRNLTQHRKIHFKHQQHKLRNVQSFNISHAIDIKKGAQERK